MKWAARLTAATTAVRQQTTFDIIQQQAIGHVVAT